MVTKKVHLTDSQEALLLFGQHDQNLRALEQAYHVQIFGRGHMLSIRGAPGKVEKALLAIKDMRDNLGRENHPVGMGSDPTVNKGSDPIPTEATYTNALGKSVRPRTANQKAYVEAMASNDLVIGIGPAGTGKTYLAVACALAALKEDKVSKIVLTRPVVEAGEKLGFLPGDFYEKVNPYLRPLYDAFYAMLGPDRFRLYRDDETIEIAPLAYMRGRTLENAFIILDEGQNATREQIKMLLTRLGQGSKLVVNGDVTQIDLASKKMSGLIQLPMIVKGISGIQIVHFSQEDVLRHPLVKEILRAYEDWEKQGERE
jgi:phosphate starvation-inducible protein PhoH and related proteins